MLNSNITFEMVGAVFGAKKELPFLLAETLYTYSGLSAIPIKTSPINSDLFSLLGDNISVTPPLKPLCKIYFKSELDILGDLSRSAGEHGLRINKDTIFGIPRVASKLETPTIRLGLAASGTPLEMPLNKLSQHMFMGGAPGSGKSNELFFLISQLHKNKIPTLIIEGAKAEFHHLRKTIPELRVWRPEEGSYVCNPFSLQGDITLGEMRDALLQTMRVCFKMEGPLEELFSRTLNNCFVKNGFSDSSKLGDVGVTPFGLSEFIQEFRHILNESGYSGRTRADIKTAGDVRLASLFNRNRGVYDSCASIPVEEMLNGYNLIQLNSLTTVEGKQMFASLLLIAISAYLRLRGKHSGGELKLAIILDESHNLLQPVSDSEGHEYPFARDFSNMLLELRASGVGLVICDQSADNLPSELVKSCQTKVFLGSLLSSGVGNYTSYLGADETSLKYLYLLGAGEGIFVTEKMPEAKYFCSPNVIQLFRLDDANYEIKNDFLEKHPRLTLETFRECASCPASGKCKHPHKIAARRISAVLCQKYGYHLEHLLEKQHEEGVLTKISNTLTRILVDIYHDTENNECLRYCTVVQFVREFNRQHSDALSVENLINNGETIWKNLDKKNSEKGVIL